ncbi:MAG: hypothetical protein QNJ38_12550 [Prochloraceae cyanobacterium]|nr:hypothetical protein [Prochloraceae cyanobacterium]
MVSLAKIILKTGGLLSLALSLILVNAPQVLAQESRNTKELRAVNKSGSLLSLEGGEKLMKEAQREIDAQKYGSAAVKLKEARQVFNQLSNFYLQLANSFAGIDPTIYERHRSNALKTGIMRDEATYQLALIHRAQQQPELSVPLLIQVIRSQNPTSELGKKSYQQLYELGFVDSPYQTSSK